MVAGIGRIRLGGGQSSMVSEEAEVLGRPGNVLGSHRRYWLAHVTGVGISELVHVLDDQVSEFVNERTTLGESHLRPRSVVERLPGRSDGGVDLWLAGLAHVLPLCLRPRVDRCERLSVSRFLGLTIYPMGNHARSFSKSSATSTIMSSWPPTIRRSPSSNKMSLVSRPYCSAAASAWRRKLEYTPA